MNITYSFKVTRIDKAAKCMDVVYSAEGHDDILVGLRLPTEGEDPKEIIAQGAPIRVWQEKMAKYVAPLVGFSGDMVVPISPVVNAELPTLHIQPTEL
jgi:hypothetical protein